MNSKVLVATWSGEEKPERGGVTQPGVNLRSRDQDVGDVREGGEVAPGRQGGEGGERVVGRGELHEVVAGLLVAVRGHRVAKGADRAVVGLGVGERGGGGGVERGVRRPQPRAEVLVGPVRPGRGEGDPGRVQVAHRWGEQHGGGGGEVVVRGDRGGGQVEGGDGPWGRLLLDRVVGVGEGGEGEVDVGGGRGQQGGGVRRGW